MKRYVDMKEISDGRFYGLNDMVKADCRDCAGCSACCRGMGSSIVLDPYDIYRLSGGLGVSMEALLVEKLELHVVEGIILPNLNMQEREQGKEVCGFLNEEGRCSIHPYRPGICRIFPLGRYYENGSFQYFLQTQECRHQNRGKVKVWKWIDTPEAKRYDTYISDWHFYVKELQEQSMAEEAGEAGRTEKTGKTEKAEELKKRRNLVFLERFFLRPYELERDFYEQFYERLEEGRKELAD